MNETNRQWVLAKRPDDLPDDSTFELKEVSIPELAEGEVRVKVDYFSLDPGSRPGLTRDSYVPAHRLDTVMMSAGIGTVTESRHEKFSVGDRVSGALGWQEWVTTKGKRLVKLDAALFGDTLPLTTAIGILGIPGLTAYFGLFSIGNMKEGETVLVSSASGTVGATAGQIARLHGATAVGLAGSQEKIDWLEGPAKFNRAINYKERRDLSAAIRESCPEGVDIYFDNVGGATLDAAIENMNQGGRIVISGLISEYNRAEPVGIRNTLDFITKRLRMEGFVVLDYVREFAAAQSELVKWIDADELIFREEIIDGLENAPMAYRELFTGNSFGRRLIRPDC